MTHLAPRSVDGDDGGLAGGDDLLGGIVGIEVLDGTVLPEVAVEGLLGTGDVDAALGLGRAVLVGKTDEAALALGGVVEPGGRVALELEVDEAGGSVLGDGDGVLGVADGGVSLGVEGVVRDLVLGNVIEGVLEGPVGEGVALGEAASDGGVLELVDPGALESLPAGAAVDHAVGVEGLETALEGLDLADLVVLLDVLLPEVGSVLLVVGLLVTDGDALGAEDLGLEAVEVLDLAEELHGLGEEVEGVDDHDLGLAVLEVAEAVEKVGDDDVAGDHGVGEDGVAVVLARDLEGEHGLLLEVLEAHLLGLGDELLLVEGIVIGGHGKGHGAGGDGRRRAGDAHLGGDVRAGSERDGGGSAGEEKGGTELHLLVWRGKRGDMKQGIFFLRICR